MNAPRRVEVSSYALRKTIFRFGVISREYGVEEFQQSQVLSFAIQYVYPMEYLRGMGGGRHRPCRGFERCARA